MIPSTLVEVVSSATPFPLAPALAPGTATVTWAAAAGAETRVRGINLAAAPGIWGSSVSTTGTHPGIGCACDELASDRHNGLNRRVGKKVNGSLTEGFLYEGQLRPVAWLDGASNVHARFVYGTRVNVPEYMVTAEGTFRILTDHLGSPRLVVNASTGAVAQRVDYDEWGVVLADSAPGFQPFGFAGGLYDRDTGLVRFGARDYDASTGRWTNKDPVRFRGGLNFYEYCYGDPVNLKDPSGLLAGGADAVMYAAADAAIANGMLGGATGIGAGTALAWAGGAGLAFGGGWLAGTWLNGYLEPHIQNGLDWIFGPPGGDPLQAARKSDLKQLDAITRGYPDLRDEFGDWIEDLKAHGECGAKNARGDFTYRELQERWKEFLRDRGYGG